MAMSTITLVALKEHDVPATVTAAAMGSIASTDDFYVATTDVYGAKFPMDYKAGRYVLQITNAGAAAVTVHARAGTSDKYGSDEDIVVPASSTIAVVIDGARHKALEGTYKGYAVITGPSACTVSVIRTPDNF